MRQPLPQATRAIEKLKKNWYRSLFKPGSVPISPSRLEVSGCRSGGAANSFVAFAAEA